MIRMPFAGAMWEPDYCSTVLPYLPIYFVEQINRSRMRCLEMFDLRNLFFFDFSKSCIMFVRALYGVSWSSSKSQFGETDNGRSGWYCIATEIGGVVRSKSQSCILWQENFGKRIVEHADVDKHLSFVFVPSIGYYSRFCCATDK